MQASALESVLEALVRARCSRLAVCRPLLLMLRCEPPFEVLELRLPTGAVLEPMLASLLSMPEDEDEETVADTSATAEERFWSLSK